MSGLRHARTNRSPPHVKKTARSAPGVSQRILSKASKPRKPRKQAKDDVDEEEEEEEVFDFEEDDHMTTTFPQYCTMCDKQILVPNSAFLYCSEHCRRMDAMPNGPHNISSYFAQSYKLQDRHHTIMDPLGLSLPRYVHAMQPTPRHFREARIPPNQHEGGKSDLDPTEWKPSENIPISDKDHESKAKLFSSKGRHEGSRPASGDRETDTETTHRISQCHSSRNGNPRFSGATHKGIRTLPPLSRTSTATASSTASSSSSSLSSPYSLVSPPPVTVATISITANSDVGRNGLESLSLVGKDELKYEKKRVKVPSKKSAASGSLKKLLGSQL